MNGREYATKLADMAPRTLLPSLGAEDAAFVRELALAHRFTYQELRLVAQAARDLEMWQEPGISIWWNEARQGVPALDRSSKKALLARLQTHVAELAASAKRYPETPGDLPARRPIRLVETSTKRRILGPCPAYSDQTVCCGLHTLDAVRGCPFSCSYCTIQTFYEDTAELEADLVRKLAEIELDPNRRYHIGTGQASDSLVWGDRSGLLQALIAFARGHPNVLLELKTKSDKVDHLLALQPPPNLVCSWTLNTSAVIENEEIGTASLGRRLEAARRVADAGCSVAFHFHPMVYYEGWDRDYPRLAERVVATFSPREVSFVSMGTVTLIKPVIQEIRRRGGATKILQMEMVSDHHGKLTYPDAIKIRLFRTLYASLSSWADDVLVYLCMETASIWEQTLGFSYPTNAVFEEDFLDRCLPGSHTAPPPGAQMDTFV